KWTNNSFLARVDQCEHDLLRPCDEKTRSTTRSPPSRLACAQGLRGNASHLTIDIAPSRYSVVRLRLDGSGSVRVCRHRQQCPLMRAELHLEGSRGRPRT